MNAGEGRETSRYSLLRFNARPSLNVPPPDPPPPNRLKMQFLKLKREFKARLKNDGSRCVVAATAEGSLALLLPAGRSGLILSGRG